MWSLGESKRTVLRANTGLMYDQTLNAIYEQALQNDGTNARASATFTPTQVGAPAFPAVLSTGSGATPNLAWTVDPDFKVARSWQNNVQFERALGDHYSIAVGTSYVKGYNLPVVTNINVINPIGTLDDGRPDLQHRHQRRDARRSALQRDQQRAVARRIDLPEPDAAVDAAPVQGHRLRLRLHARQERGQRADHRHAVGAG